jgi:L-ascorbate metabolism protein UlaG (beta-lactamase superfamily)
MPENYRPRVWKAPRILAAPRRSQRPIAAPPAIPDPGSWEDRGLYAAWLGHSTVLLKIDGVVILTDPILSDRAGLNLGLVTVGIRRRVAPALALEDLPRPDLILLSHAHMDHFDMPSLRKLAHPSTTIVTARHTADLLHPERYRRVVELGWGENTRVGEVECRAFEVNHWGARFHSDTWRGYNGYTLSNGRYRVVFGGDTALTDSFRRLRGSKPYDLAIMPIGAYFPRVYYHCTPEQAWEMGNDAGAERFLPVHHQTFELGQEPVDEPIERFYAAAGNQFERIALSHIGQHVQIS